MKKLFLLFGIFALISCASVEPATSYYYRPCKNDTNIGQILDINEKGQYSIVFVSNLTEPLYIKGRLNDIILPCNDCAYLWVQKDRKHMVYQNRRYLIDEEITMEERISSL